MRTHVWIAVLVVVLSGASHAVAQDDHPLVSRYKGSTVASKKAEEFGEYKLVTGRSQRGELTGETLEGKVTRIVSQNPPGRSTLGELVAR